MKSWLELPILRFTIGTLFWLLQCHIPITRIRCHTYITNHEISTRLFVFFCEYTVSSWWIPVMYLPICWGLHYCDGVHCMIVQVHVISQAFTSRNSQACFADDIYWIFRLYLYKTEMRGRRIFDRVPSRPSWGQEGTYAESQVDFNIRQLDLIWFNVNFRRTWWSFWPFRVSMIEI